MFVHKGTSNYTGGFSLGPNERLIGEAANLVVGSDTLLTGDASKRPTITDTNDDVVALDDANQVRGLQLDPQGTGGGIAGATGDTGGATIDDVRIIDTGTAGSRPGLELVSTTGTFNISNLTVNNSATGVRLHNTTTPANAVNAVFTPAGLISIQGNGNPGLSVTGTPAVPVTVGTSTFDDITVTGSGSGGVNITNATGTTTFGDGTGTDLNLSTTSGAAPAFNLGSAGTVIVDTAGVDNISSNGGPAIDVTGTSGATLNFDDVDSTNSANDGINLDGLGNGTFSATSGDIGGAAGIAFDLNSGSGAITYPGDLDNGSGATAEITGRSGSGAVTLSGQLNDTNDAGGGITVSSNTGGSTTFSNATKTLNTGASDALVFNNSDGHTLTLSGGSLDIDTTSGKGLEATNSGTLNVTGTGNTIDSTSATALNVTNTDIGASGAAFQRISLGNNNADADPANGIVLNNTGSNGGLTVTGTGTASSGGTIQNTTGAGVSLNSTRDVSFDRMKI